MVRMVRMVFVTPCRGKRAGVTQLADAVRKRDALSAVNPHYQHLPTEVGQDPTPFDYPVLQVFRVLLTVTGYLSWYLKSDALFEADIVSI